jgi:hypothetical protein
MSVSPDEIDGRTPNKDSTAWRTRTDCGKKKSIKPTRWHHDQGWKSHHCKHDGKLGDHERQDAPRHFVHADFADASHGI